MAVLADFNIEIRNKEKEESLLLLHAAYRHIELGFKEYISELSYSFLK